MRDGALRRVREARLLKHGGVWLATACLAAACGGGESDAGLAAVGSSPSAAASPSAAGKEIAVVALAVGDMPVAGLTGSVSTAATAVNLSTEGSADWAHWGDGVPGLVRKAGVTAQIGAYAIVGGGAASAYGNDPRPMSWTAGTPTATGTGRRTGVWVGGQNAGFAVAVPADTAARTVKLYVGGWNSSGRLVAQLSDGSAPNYTDVTAAVGGQYNRSYTLTYSAASAGQQLRLTWTQASTGGNVTLNGVALAGAPAANLPPVLTAPAAQSTPANQPVTLAVAASDPNGDTLGFTATGLPPGLAIAPASGVISGTAGTVGVYTPTVVVQDGRGGSANATFSWTVQAPAPVNRPPVLTAPAAQVTTVNRAVSLAAVASDPDGDALTYTATGLPPGVAIAPASGVISGSPTAVGSYTVALTVRDPQAASATASFAWSVQAAVAAGARLSGTASAAATAVNLSTEGPADWAHWGDGVPGLVRKAGVTAQIGAYTIVGGGAASAYGNDPRPMSWTGGTPTATGSSRQTGVWVAGQNAGFSVTVPADTAVRTVKLYVGGWNSSGRLVAQLSDGSAPNYTDTTTAVGGQYDRNYTLTYSAASAGQQLRLTWTQASTSGNVTLNGAALTVALAPANQPPVLTAPAAQTTTVNQAASLALTASDPNGDVLAYAATGLPPGLAIAPATGAITGTANTVGLYAPNVVVQDGRGGSANATFSWTVQAAVTEPPPPPPTVAQRTQAVTATAQSTGNACTAVQPFYWEFGDSSAALASGSTDAAGGNPVYTATTPMAVASASKWVYGAYVAEKRAGVLTASDVQYLTFRSGYTSFDEFGTCGPGFTVDGCLYQAGNSTYTAAHEGRFFYDSGHMQRHASLEGLGAMDNAALATEIRSQLGTDIALGYLQPQIAGGLETTPADYARFLRKLLGNQLRLGALLGRNAVCTNPATCSTAVFASQPGNESWQYAIGHWIDADPGVGDGAFSSTGAFGFHPWIDAGKTTYGLIARRTPTAGDAADRSVACGRLLRKAWSTGTAR